MGVLLLLVLLLIVLLWKCHSREGGKAPTDSTPFGIKYKAVVYEITAGTVTSNICAEILSQHDGTHDDEDYIENHSLNGEIHSNEDCAEKYCLQRSGTRGNEDGIENRLQHDETHGNEDYVETLHDGTHDNEDYAEIPHDRTYDNEKYAEIRSQQDQSQGNETVDTAIPTEHIEAHDDGAYQTTVTVIATKPYAVYEENTVHGGTVDHQDDCKEYAVPCYRTTATADPTEHIETCGNETTATVTSMEPYAALEENAAYGGTVYHQDDCKEYAVPRYQTTATANPTEHIKTHENEKTATVISTEQYAALEENAAYGGTVYNQDEEYVVPCYQTTATADPTEQIEIHSNEISGTIISTEPYAALEENAAYGGTVYHQDEEYAVPRYQTTATANSTELIEIHSNEAYQTTATADPTEHIDTHSNEAYTTNPTEHIEIHGNVAYQTTATADPTEQIETHSNEAYHTTNPTEHIEIHGNEAYQTTATADPTEHIETTISTKPSAAYGNGVVNQDNYEEIDAYSSVVDNQDDYGEYAELRYQ